MFYSSVSCYITFLVKARGEAKKVFHKAFHRVNSSPPSATHLRQWIGAVLVWIMACRLFDTKPLSKPMPVVVKLNLWSKLQWNFKQNTKNFIHKNTSYLKMSSAKWRPFCSGRWVNGDNVISYLFNYRVWTYTGHTLCHHCLQIDSYLSVTVKQQIQHLSHDVCFVQAIYIYIYMYFIVLSWNT